MNTVRLVLLLGYWPTVLYAQINWGDYSQSFPDKALNNHKTVALILAIHKDNNSFWAIQEHSIHFDEFAKDTAFKQTRLTELVARTTFDTAKAQFFLHGVNRQNSKAYEFRVVEYPSRTVLVPWRAITQFTDSTVTKQSGMPQMAYLGGYKAPLESMLIVNIRKKGDQSITATNLVAWESIRPSVSSVYTSADLDVFLQKLQYPWARTRLDKQTPYSLTNLRLPATNTNLVYVLNANIYSKKQVQYQLFHDDQIITPWHDNEYDNSFVWLNGFLPGSYRIQIRYTAQPQHVREYHFEVEPAWYQSIWFKLALVGVGIVIAGLFVFGFLLIRQRSKTRREAANKQKMQLELRALYAQLNPHFIFNALSSIQGLVNRQDLKGANEYLSDFARLMRESLQNGGREETSLQQELQTMETYLKLEQLRFGFIYDIQVTDQLDVYATNIPSLLWQPLLENAVKHGVSSRQKDGHIMVCVEKANDDLLIRIIDNGRGMTTYESTTGLGLKLTRDRIHLLNELNREQPIVMQLNSQEVGMEVTLSFTHWLL